MSGWFLLLPCFIEITEFSANSVDPDLTLHFDLGLHFFQCSFYGTIGINGLKIATDEEYWRGHGIGSVEEFEGGNKKCLFSFKCCTFKVLQGSIVLLVLHLTADLVKKGAQV